MVEYIVRAQSDVGGFNSSFTNLHDASVCVRSIKEVNTLEISWVGNYMGRLLT